MLGELVRKFAEITQLLSFTAGHVATLCINDSRFDYSSKKYATEKYRFQHFIGKIGSDLQSELLGS